MFQQADLALIDKWERAQRKKEGKKEIGGGLRQKELKKLFKQAD